MVQPFGRQLAHTVGGPHDVAGVGGAERVAQYRQPCPRADDRVFAPHGGPSKGLLGKGRYLRLLQISDSCCLAYEADMQALPGTDVVWFVPTKRDYELNTIAVVDLSDWDAQAIVWMPPLSQWAMFDSARPEHWPSVVRAVADGPVGPLLDICASKDFFNLKTEFLKRLSNFLVVTPSPAASLFDLIMDLKRHISRTILLVEQRVKHMRLKGSNMKQVLHELDEGIGMIEQQDGEEVRKERQRCRPRLADGIGGTARR